MVLLVLYNLTYTFAGGSHWLTNFIDNTVNALMMTGVLFLNLVLIDSQKITLNELKQVRVETEKEVKKFLLPKIIICGAIFIVLFFFYFTHS
jgi:precorrin-6B methylase 2